MSGRAIDYSKWDKLETSSDEEEVVKNQPVVTKFDTPQSVTIGGSGAGAAAVECAPCPRTSSASAPVNSIDVSLWSKNGGMLVEYVWRQDRYAVDILLALPKWLRNEEGIVKGKDLNVEILDEGRKMCLKARRPGEGEWQEIGVWELAFAVEEEEDAWMWQVMRVEMQDANIKSPFGEDGDAAVAAERRSVSLRSDWMSESSADGLSSSVPVGKACWNLLAVFLKKKAKIAGLTVWWRCFFKGDPQSTAADECRSTSEIESAKSLQASWEEAHTAFRERLKHKEKIPISVDHPSEECDN